MSRTKHLVQLLALAAILFAPFLFSAGCGGQTDRVNTLPDTIKVATVYGPASFFYYRDTTMGYDYDMMEQLASLHSRSVEWIIVGSIEDAIAKVDSGLASIVASPIPTHGEFEGKVVFCGPETDIEQVLVQPPGDTVIVNVGQLAGRIVYVQKGSKGADELERLNAEMGGSILVRPVDADSMATEDMLASVAHGDISLAVVDRATARLNKSYFPELNITLALSDPETAKWGISKKTKWLADTINAWMACAEPREIQAGLLKKYFDSYKNFPVEGAPYDRNFENGYASPYDQLFKEHTDSTTWDWRMLAAQAYQESRFNPKARSWAGASGLMQIMPRTARQFGLKKSEFTDPSRSIETAVKILNNFDAILADRVPNPIERKKFTLAAYNAGPGHVLDAIRLAEKHGYDPQVWDDNVEKAMLMKMNKKYYRDPVVKYGYSRGRETVDYVKKIYAYYDEAKEKIPH